MKQWMIFLFMVMAGVLPFAVQGATPIYVDATNGSNAYDGQAAVWDGTHGPKQTIQAGIGVVDLGGTVIVAAGSYPENVTVNKTVSLLGNPGAILQGAGAGNGFLIQAPNIYISDFEITNFSIGIRSFGGPANYVNLNLLRNNIHHNLTVGIQLVFDTFNVVGISDCLINNTTGGSGISISNGTTIEDLDITNSTVSANRDHGLYINNGVTATLTNVSIENCNFTNQVNFGGIFIQRAAIGAFSMTGGQLSGNKGMGLSVNQQVSTLTSLLLDGIVVTSNGESGVLLGGGSTAGNLTVNSCTFQNNGWEHFDLSGGWFGAFTVTGASNFNSNIFYGGPWAAVYVGDLGVFGSAPVLRHNYFMANNWGVSNANAVAMDAEFNYWNSMHGPNDGAGTTEVALGDPDPGVLALLNAQPAGLLGASVTNNNVDYFPWLGSPAVLTPTSQHFASGGGSNSVGVAAPPGYAWTAVSNDLWITVTAGTPGNGNGTVNYTVAPNLGLGLRTGTITIAYQTFTVTQDGATGTLAPLFYATPTHGWPGMVVQFEDFSSGNPSAWFWQFGDGQTSILKNPVIMFTKPGAYDVTLSITVGATIYTYTEKGLIVVYGNSPLCRATLELVEGSDACVKEMWDHAIDDDVSGINAMATVKGDPPYAIFKFKDGTTKQIESVSMLTDTHVGFAERWAQRFEVLVSTTGPDAGNFTSVLQAVRAGGGWEDYSFTPVAAKYIKLVIHEPAFGWRQIGEFQVCPVRIYADAALSSLSVSSPHTANGLDQGMVTMAPVAADGTPISGLTFDDFRLIDWSSSLKWSQVTETKTPGVYTATFTSTFVGVKKIDCYVNGIFLGAVQTEFVAPVAKFAKLVLVEASDSYHGEGWDNAIDGDFADWDGTVTAKGNPAWAVFAFADGATKSLQKLNLLVDTGVGYDARWVKKFHIMVSTATTVAADFVTIYKGQQNTGDWHGHSMTSAPAKYIKFVVDEPARDWCQIGEIEVYASDGVAAAQFAAKPQSNQPAVIAVNELTSSNFPNPFNPETIVEYALPQSGRVNVAVYNLLGQQIRTLFEGNCEIGVHQVRWDGRDRLGQMAPSGLYLLRVQTETGTKVHRMVMMK